MSGIAVTCSHSVSQNVGIFAINSRLQNHSYFRCLTQSKTFSESRKAVNTLFPICVLLYVVNITIYIAFLLPLSISRATFLPFNFSVDFSSLFVCDNRDNGFCFLILLLFAGDSGALWDHLLGRLKWILILSFAGNCTWIEGSRLQWLPILPFDIGFPLCFACFVRFCGLVCCQVATAIDILLMIIE